VTGSLDRPTYEGEISRLKTRVDALERQLRKFATHGPPELTFIFSGTLAARTSPKKRSPYRRFYRTCIIDLVTAGSTATTIRFTKNGGVASDDLIVPAGEEMWEFRVALGVSEKVDAVRCQIVTPGVGSIGLTADLWQ
jgi:hypothetical protein